MKIKMLINGKRFLLMKQGSTTSFYQLMHRCYHRSPFIELYERTTGQQVTDYYLEKLKKKHPSIVSLSHDRLQCSLQILHKFNITPLEACQDAHVFTMNPITMDNYGEILRECCFIQIIPKHLMRYHTIVRSNTIANLKKKTLIRDDLNLQEVLHDCIPDMPSSSKPLQNFPDTSTSVLTVRMHVLENYLKWRLSITSDEFTKYCQNYLPLKHKPLSDIREALNIAENDIEFNMSAIRRNGFIISSDPINTKLILENVRSLAGFNIREAIRLEPAILKNNYNALIQIRSLLEDYRIPVEAQQRCLRVYCMRPDTVKERLDELRNLKEYQVLRTNPRVLTMVVHKRKMMNRLEKIQAARKLCFSLNHLVSSSKVFNNYIGSFGNKVCGRDIATLISSSLQVDTSYKLTESEKMQYVLTRLKRHKFWLHAALNVIDENIKFLKEKFSDDVILNNCQILLYPVIEIEQYIKFLQKLRTGDMRANNAKDIQLDSNYNNLRPGAITDAETLSLVLYEIEKKYHFSGDGIWARQDGVKVDAHAR